MAANTLDTPTLQIRTERGWLAGFANLFSRENADWLRLRTLISRSLRGIAIVNGITAAVILGEQTAGNPTGQVTSFAVEGFIQILAIFASIGAIIRAQDAVIGDRQLGITAWILSKPVSRAAYLVSKFVANAIGIVVTMILVESVVGYLEIGLLSGQFFPLDRFVMAVLVAVPSPLFYYGLGLFLGVFFGTRGTALGIPLALLLGYQLISGAIPSSVYVMPWGLSIAAQQLLTGTPVLIAPVIAVPLLTVALLALAVYRFDSQDL